MEQRDRTVEDLAMKRRVDDRGGAPLPQPDPRVRR